MEDNEEKKDMEATAESVENEKTSKVEETKKEEKTFTRDEVNKMIFAEKQKERQAVLNELKIKKAEADKLAKMDEDQKKDYQLQEAIKRAEIAEKKLTARDLETETLKQANDKGIPLELIKTIDFEKETAESISNKLDIFEKSSNSIREKAINEYSKEDAPQTGDRPHEKSLSELKTYAEIEEYYRKHPEAN